MERVFQTIVDRTRARLDVPKARTLFGAKRRPYRDRTSTSRVEAVVETPEYDLTIFKVCFGNLTLQGIHQRRLRPAFRGDRAQHQRPGAVRVIDRFCEIVTRLHAMADRFGDILDCVDAAFVADDTLD
ncbi:MAG: hypothetical protein ACRD0K_29720 [Egibacteraceae bacterium]